MNNSQRSDCSSENNMNMQNRTYESLILNTKLSFNKHYNEIRKPTNSMYLITLLQDCNTCITQSLDLINDQILESDVNINVLRNYLENVVAILQSLSTLVKSTIEFMPLSCTKMKTFPILTTEMVLLVFLHCKESESIYGCYLTSVEKQLKELFRTCHELQLIYLMALEKHFIFDFTETDQQNIFIQALDVNLRIGEIVQSLDVKTMAEQWKSLTVICEKYSTYLSNNDIFNKMTKVLCKMIENNIKQSLEMEQDEKLIARSLKIAGFMIKILMKFCDILKNATGKNYDHVVELLIFINLNNEAILVSKNEYSSSFTHLIQNNVTQPIDNFIAELVQDDSFLNCVVRYNSEWMQQDDNLLGYIFLMPILMKFTLQINDSESTIMAKSKLINRLFDVLPHCYKWFNTELKIKKLSKNETEGFYEHLLSHAAAFSVTLNSELYSVLEQNMYNAVMGISCCSALFATDLWTILARLSNRQLVLKQLVILCGIFKSLQSNNIFEYSPQKNFLSNLINRLFELMPNEDKIVVLKQFNFQDESNISLWCTLRINNLPKHIEMELEEIVCMNMRNKFLALTSADLNNKSLQQLTRIMKLAATCFFTSNENTIEELLLIAWQKACPKTNRHIVLQGDINKGILWYYEYVNALVMLTNSLSNIFSNSGNLVKILHVLRVIAEMGNTEFKLLLIELLCKISTCSIQDSNKSLVDSLLSDTFQIYLLGDDSVVKTKLISKLKNYIHNKHLEITIMNVLKENSLHDVWNYLKHGEIENFNKEMWQKQLKVASELKYVHKCIESKHENWSDSQTSLETRKSCSNNFDFADIDTLFDQTNENDSEPACKRVKLNCNEIQDIINNLDIGATTLCKFKPDLTNEHKSRIIKVCDKLRNIIT